MAGVLFQHCLVSIVNTIVNRSLDGSYCRLCLGSSGYRSIYWTRRGLARSRNQTPWMFLPLRQGAVAVAVGLWWYSPFVLNRHVTCVIWVMFTDVRNAIMVGGCRKHMLAFHQCLVVRIFVKKPVNCWLSIYNIVKHLLNVWYCLVPSHRASWPAATPDQTYNYG